MVGIIGGAVIVITYLVGRVAVPLFIRGVRAWRGAAFTGVRRGTGIGSAVGGIARKLTPEVDFIDTGEQVGVIAGGGQGEQVGSSVISESVWQTPSRRKKLHSKQRFGYRQRSTTIRYTGRRRRSWR